MHPTSGEFIRFVNPDNGAGIGLPRLEKKRDKGDKKRVGSGSDSDDSEDDVLDVNFRLAMGIGQTPASQPVEGPTRVKYRRRDANKRLVGTAALQSRVADALSLTSTPQPDFTPVVIPPPAAAAPPPVHKSKRQKHRVRKAERAPEFVIKGIFDAPPADASSVTVTLVPARAVRPVPRPKPVVVVEEPVEEFLPPEFQPFQELAVAVKFQGIMHSLGFLNVRMVNLIAGCIFNINDPADFDKNKDNYFNISTYFNSKGGAKLISPLPPMMPILGTICPQLRSTSVRTPCGNVLTCLDVGFGVTSRSPVRHGMDHLIGGDISVSTKNLIDSISRKEIPHTGLNDEFRDCLSGFFTSLDPTDRVSLVTFTDKATLAIAPALATPDNKSSWVVMCEDRRPEAPLTPKQGGTELMPTYKYLMTQAVGIDALNRGSGVVRPQRITIMTDGKNDQPIPASLASSLYEGFVADLPQTAAVTEFTVIGIGLDSVALQQMRNLVAPWGNRGQLIDLKKTTSKQLSEILRAPPRVIALGSPEIQVKAQSHLIVRALGASRPLEASGRVLALPLPDATVGTNAEVLVEVEVRGRHVPTADVRMENQPVGQSPLSLQPNVAPDIRHRSFASFTDGEQVAFYRDLLKRIQQTLEKAEGRRYRGTLVDLEEPRGREVPSFYMPAAPQLMAYCETLRSMLGLISHKNRAMESHAQKVLSLITDSCSSNDQVARDAREELALALSAPEQLQLNRSEVRLETQLVGQSQLSLTRWEDNTQATQVLPRYAQHRRLTEIAFYGDLLKRVEQTLDEMDNQRALYESQLPGRGTMVDLEEPPRGRVVDLEQSTDYQMLVPQLRSYRATLLAMLPRISFNNYPAKVHALEVLSLMKDSCSSDAETAREGREDLRRSLTRAPQLALSDATRATIPALEEIQKRGKYRDISRTEVRETMIQALLRDPQFDYFIRPSSIPSADCFVICWAEPIRKKKSKPDGEIIEVNGQRYIVQEELINVQATKKGTRFFVNNAASPLDGTPLEGLRNLLWAISAFKKLRAATKKHTALSASQLLQNELRNFRWQYSAMALFLNRARGAGATYLVNPAYHLAGRSAVMGLSLLNRSLNLVTMIGDRVLVRPVQWLYGRAIWLGTRTLEGVTAAVNTLVVRPAYWTARQIARLCNAAVDGASRLGHAIYVPTAAFVLDVITAVGELLDTARRLAVAPFYFAGRQLRRLASATSNALVALFRAAYRPTAALLRATGRAIRATLILAGRQLQRSVRALSNAVVRAFLAVYGPTARFINGVVVATGELLDALRRIVMTPTYWVARHVRRLVNATATAVTAFFHAIGREAANFAADCRIAIGEILATMRDTVVSSTFWITRQVGRLASVSARAISALFRVAYRPMVALVNGLWTVTGHLLSGLRRFAVGPGFWTARQVLRLLTATVEGIGRTLGVTADAAARAANAIGRALSATANAIGRVFRAVYQPTVNFINDFLQAIGELIATTGRVIAFPFTWTSRQVVRLYNGVTWVMSRAFHAVYDPAARFANAVASGGVRLADALVYGVTEPIYWAGRQLQRLGNGVYNATTYTVAFVLAPVFWLRHPIVAIGTGLVNGAAATARGVNRAFWFVATPVGNALYAVTLPVRLVADWASRQFAILTAEREAEQRA